MRSSAPRVERCSDVARRSFSAGRDSRPFSGIFGRLGHLRFSGMTINQLHGGHMKRITLLAASFAAGFCSPSCRRLPDAAGLIGSQDTSVAARSRARTCARGLLDRLDQRAEVQANAAGVEALKDTGRGYSAHQKPAAGRLSSDPQQAATGSPDCRRRLLSRTRPRSPLAGPRASIETPGPRTSRLRPATSFSFHYDLRWRGGLRRGGSPRMFVDTQGRGTVNDAPAALSDQATSHQCASGADQHVTFDGT